MQTDENACIRYLMKEMDPSEEVLMERAMMEDDDLLIEVESLRQTFKRLDDLPRKNPPAHLTDSIVQKAADNAKVKRNSSPIHYLFNYRYVAAAAVLIGMVGGVSVYMSSTSSEAASTPGSSQTVSAQQQNISAPDPQALRLSNTATNTTQPWVDRNDVLYFNDQFNKGANDFNAILQSSLQKLTPLSDPFYYNTGLRTLQMTSSPVHN